MLKKFLRLLKYLGAVTGVLLAVISCEKDFKNVGVDIVDNNLFTTGRYDVENITSYGVNIDKNKTNRLDSYLLGTYEDANFGTLTASVVTQLGLTNPNPDFGSNAVIDSVLLNIPLEATLDGTQEATDPNDPNETINVPNFVLDSIWNSGTDHTFNLKIFELGTYLNNLDPNDPTKINKYYSDDSFLKLGQLYNANIYPDRNDTIMVIKRRKYADDNLIPAERVIFKYDTIVNAEKKPSIKIPFDNETFKTRFQDMSASTEFASNADFQHYFRGLFLEASNTGNGTSLLSLKLSQASFTIYYSETSFQDEDEGVDLDGNGITGETNVAVGEGKSLDFPLRNILVNLYDRDYSGFPIENYLNNPNTTQGSDKLYISGAAGSDAVIHLFGEDTNTNNIPDELEILRTHQWLINDAKLYLYVNSDNTGNPVPERLYLYKIDSNGDAYQTYDALTLGSDLLGGRLVKDSDGNPDYYLFHITNYISEVIQSDTEVPITDFGVKTFVQNDVPLQTTDSIMREYNDNFKNIILNGNLPVAADRRIKLEIYYSEKNN